MRCCGRLSYTYSVVLPPPSMTDVILYGSFRYPWNRSTEMLNSDSQYRLITCVTPSSTPTPSLVSFAPVLLPNAMSLPGTGAPPIGCSRSYSLLIPNDRVVFLSLKSWAIEVFTVMEEKSCSSDNLAPTLN